MANTPSTTPLIFKVKENNYTVSKITVGNLMKIEVMKAEISGNKYGSILANRTVWSEYTLDNIDMFAHLFVFFPELIKDLNVDSWEDLDPFDLQQLTKEYQAQFRPWFSNFAEILRKPIVDETAEQK